MTKHIKICHPEADPDPEHIHFVQCKLREGEGKAEGSLFRFFAPTSSWLRMTTFFSILLLLTPFLFASIEIEPMRLELEPDAGKTSEGYLTLTNRGNEDIDISFSPGEYRYVFSDNTIFPSGSKSQTLPSCKGWINLKPDKIKLEKNAKKNIRHTINIPAASSGEYLACILIDEERQAAPPLAGKTGQVNIKITPRISIPVYVAIKNSLRRSCEISDLSAIVSDDKKYVELSLTFKNTGTAHIRPVTTLLVLDEENTLANKIPLGKSLPVFAGFGEKLSARWKPRFSGKYTLVATVDIGAEPLIQKSIAFEVEE